MFHHGKKSLRGQYTVPAWQPGVPVPMRAAQRCVSSFPKAALADHWSDGTENRVAGTSISRCYLLTQIFSSPPLIVLIIVPY